MSRRGAIAMTPDEVAAFLAEERVLTCASLGRDGWPHLMPLWYALRAAPSAAGAGVECWAWTYGKSQKVRNLERDPRCTVQVEAGEGYDELRGVMIKAECEIQRDPIAVAAVGEEVAARHYELTPEAHDAIRERAPKRVALRFIAREIATWDHRKL